MQKNIYLCKRLAILSIDMIIHMEGGIIYETEHKFPIGKNLLR